VDNLRLAQDDGHAGVVRGVSGDVDMQRLAAVFMRLGGLFDDRQQGRAAQMQILFAGAAHRMQDVAAAVGLLADQLGVFIQVRLAVQLFLQLGAGKFDGGQRRAQLVGCGGNHPAQVGQLLLAGQCHLGGHQRLAHRMGLRGHAARVKRQKPDANHDRDPEPRDKELRHFQNRALHGDQRQVEHCQRRDQDHRQPAHQQGGAQPQGHGRHGDRVISVRSRTTPCRALDTPMPEDRSVMKKT